MGVGVSLSGQEVGDAEAAGKQGPSFWLALSFLLISRFWLPLQELAGTAKEFGLGLARVQSFHVPLTVHMCLAHTWQGEELWAGVQGPSRAAASYILVARYPGVNCSSSTIPSVTSARFSPPSLSLPTCEMVRVHSTCRALALSPEQ